jgi:sulfide dehydrogenase [flavocytochrome c] flavoprotein subunit
MDRRQFIASLAAGSAMGLTGLTPAFGAAIVNVVVVGGGMAGTTAAKYLKLWGAASGLDIRVTLIDANAAYVSCILSNKVLTGETTLAALTYRYTKLAGLGVTVVQGQVAAVDKANRVVRLADGRTYPYARLILAPGIDFDYSALTIAARGLTADQALAAVPHAWKAGPQTTELRRQLVALTNGNRVVMTIPAAPYRCPPGPYERACAIAGWLKANRPKSKLIVLDANARIIAEPVNFGRAFSETYRTIIEYYPGVTMTGVTWDSAAPKVKTVSLVDAGGAAVTMPAEVVNLIPPQKAGRVAIDALGPTGLSANGRWALVDEISYESKVFPGIHVIGDAINSKQPKAGHIGNQEAKICADAILRLESGRAPYAAPVTNSACFTPITPTTATWLTAVYRYQTDIDPATGQSLGTKSMQMVSGNPVGVASETPTGASGDNADAMKTWFASLMVDTFG